MAKAEHREECLQRAKSEAGLADYQVRTWIGWRHHQALSLVTAWFLTQEKRRGGSATAITVPRVRSIIALLLHRALQCDQPHRVCRNVTRRLQRNEQACFYHMNSSGTFWLRWIISIGCGLPLFCSPGSMVRAAESARDRFLREAPQKWLEYREIVCRHTEGTFKNVSTFHIGETVSHSSAEGTFAFSSDCQGVRLASKKEAVVCNSEYSFELKDGDGEWTIRDLRMNVAWHMPDDFIGRDPLRPIVRGEGGSFGMVMENTCAGQMLWGGWFPLMVSSPDFRLVRVTDVPGDGDLIKVEFEFEPTGMTGGNAPARSGMVVLDAKRYWLIRQAETKASGVYGQGSLKITNKFTDDMMPIPFVSRCTIHMVIPKHRQFDGKRYEGEFVWDTNMHDAPELDKKQFMLSAYGFPEPGTIQPSRVRAWLFCITIILLTFCILRVMYQRYRRWRRA